jgi:hypothetical protein
MSIHSLLLSFIHICYSVCVYIETDFKISLLLLKYLLQWFASHQYEVVVFDF